MLLWPRSNTGAAFSSRFPSSPVAKKERQPNSPDGDDNVYFQLGVAMTARQAPFVHRSPTCQPVAFILAGGKSLRMGRDKALLKIDGRTLMQIIRATAVAAGFQVRVVRRDQITPCGPLSGVLTAFARSCAPELTFLSCDMPFVTANLLRELLQQRAKAVFVCSQGRAGFPFKIARDFMPVLEKRIKEGKFSIQGLAAESGALRWQPKAVAHSELSNFNTPEEWGLAMARMGTLQDS